VLGFAIWHLLRPTPPVVCGIWFPGYANQHVSCSDGGPALYEQGEGTTAQALTDPLGNLVLLIAGQRE
jgi:hypothetical protein